MSSPLEARDSRSNALNNDDEDEYDLRVREVNMSGDDYVDDDDDWIWDVEMPGENEREKRSFDDMNDDEEVEDDMRGAGDEDGSLFRFDLQQGEMRDDGKMFFIRLDTRPHCGRLATRVTGIVWGKL